MSLELEMIEVPPRDWVPETEGAFDVVVIGAGLSGLAIAFGLVRQGIRRFLVLDKSPQGRVGLWRSPARMDILRSPKTQTAPDLGVPSLTFCAWFEARRGASVWTSLGQIAREDWAEYLRCYMDVLDLPVRNDTALLGFRPDGAALLLDIVGPDGPDALRTRRLVLATGIDGNGRPHVPAEIAALPHDRWCHSTAPFEAARLRGLRFGIIGAAASAFDCAVTALRGGVGSVVLMARRNELPRVEGLAWVNFPGFMSNLPGLDDERRWRFMRRLLELQAPWQLLPSTRRSPIPASRCGLEHHLRRLGWRRMRLCSRVAAQSIASMSSCSAPASRLSSTHGRSSHRKRPSSHAGRIDMRRSRTRSGTSLQAIPISALALSSPSGFRAPRRILLAYTTSTPAPLRAWGLSAAGLPGCSIACQGSSPGLHARCSSRTRTGILSI